MKRLGRITLISLFAITIMFGTFAETPLLKSLSAVDEAYAASYTSDYRMWTQADSSYKEVREVGCLITAQARMLAENGICTNGFNPDTWYLYLRNHGGLVSPPNNLFMTATGFSCPETYAQSLGKKVQLMGKNWAAKESNFWFNINAGYNTIIHLKEPKYGYDHYVLIDNKTSLATGKIYIYDSFSDSRPAQPSLLYNRYSRFVESIVYKCETNQNPRGCADVIEDAQGKVHVKGWAFDPDTPSKSITVHVYIGGNSGSGAPSTAVSANLSRPDVNAAYGISGNHGFEATIETAKRGNQQIVIYAIDTSGGNSPEIINGNRIIYITEKPAPPTPSAKAASCSSYDHNLQPKATLYNPDRSTISSVSITVKDGDSIVAQKTRQLASGSTNAVNATAEFDINKDCDVQLLAGHEYSWQISANIGGKTYSTGWTKNKTTGTPKPSLMTMSTSKSNYAVGDAATVSWGTDLNATKGYSLTLKQISGGDYTETLTTSTASATSLAFTLPTAGEYEITGFARGTDDGDVSKLNKTITAHDPSKVRFVELDNEGNENLLCEQTVRYGYSATAPTGIARKGHTFTGWKGEYSNVTSDRTIVAQFKKNTYKVTFLDKDGDVIETQSVLFEEDATAPEPPAAETGYVFAGWDSEDYLNVQGNATIRATYVWANAELPVHITLNSCEFKEDGYIVNYNIKNNPTDRTKGRAFVSLKTSQGKLLDSTESKAFSLAAGEEKTGVEIYMPYEGIATVVELYIVNGYSKGIPISEVRSKEISRDWSDWSTKEPDPGKEIESRTEYRYKDLQSMTTRTESNSGWTLDKKVLDSSWNYGSWSSWARTSYTANETTTAKREVETKTVSDNNSYTISTYYYWKAPNRLDFSYYNEGGMVYYEYSQASNDNQPRMYYYGDYQGHAMYRLNNNNYGYGVNFDSEVWFLKETRTVPATTHTESRYRDGTKGYTYYWSKWSDWSDWSDTACQESDTKQVETRTAYRYRASMEEIEDNSGKSYTISGKVDSSLAGKQATLLVYKYDEPSDSNNEYVGQMAIGEDGGYSFTFIPKQEISAKTGDYTVALALEGAENPVYLETIEAPKPEYTVTFKDDNGNIIDTQTVSEGKSATSPRVPNKEHYTFVGWDFGFTNVRDDMEITAQYAKNKYSVAFVNWDTREVETEVFSYGDPVAYPEATEIKGYDFTGWTDLDGDKVETVTGNTVLKANYKIKSYNITFYDNEGEELSKQIVRYGEDAIEPSVAQIDNMIFKGWSTYAFKQVSKDVDVYPNYEWNETTAAPTCDAESGVYKETQIVHLSAEEGAAIYYTTDGSLPTRASNKYIDKVEISVNTPLRFMAVSPEKNVSETQLVSFLIASGEDDEGALVVKKEEYNIDRGSKGKITYFLSHEDPDMGVNFYSLNDEIASVDENGNVSANNVGTTKVFISTKDNKYADYCDVIVSTDDVEAESIVLNVSSLTGIKDTTANLTAKVLPEDATVTDVDWFVDDANIATVSNDGEVTFRSKGETTITACSKDGAAVAECSVQCVNALQESKLDISPNTAYVKKGEKELVLVTHGESIVGCTYSSSDDEVATVNASGTVTGVKEGVATITATTADDNELSCVVIVSEDTVWPEVSLHVCSADTVTLVRGTPSTCLETGIKDYYECTCGNYYEDEDCTTAIDDVDTWKILNKSEHTLALVNFKAATTDKEGYTGDVICSVCKETIETGTVIPKAGELEDVQEQLEEAQSNLDKANKQISDLEAEKTGLESQVTEKQAAVEAAQSKLTKAESDLEKAKADLEKVEGDKTAAEKALAEKQAAYEQAQSNLEAAEAAKQAAIDEKNAIIAEKQAAEERAKAAEAEVARLKAELEISGGEGHQHEWDSTYTVDMPGTATSSGYKSIHCKGCELLKKLTVIPKASESCLSANSFVYDGKEHKPTVYVRDESKNKLDSAFYEIAWTSENKSIGTHECFIFLKGDYTGHIDLSYKIVPKAVTQSTPEKSTKAFTAKWKKSTSANCSGYQIRYSTKSSMASSVTKTVTGYSKTSYKVTKLKANKKYYVQVRCYKTVNGKKYYSAWSAKKTVTTK